MNEKAFYTIDGKELLTIVDLINYLRSCDAWQYAHHVNNERNDFANWINFVFGNKLFEIVKSCSNKEAIINALEIYNFATENKTLNSKEKNQNVTDYKNSEIITDADIKDESIDKKNIDIKTVGIKIDDIKNTASDNITDQESEVVTSNMINAGLEDYEREKKLEKYVQFVSKNNTNFIKPGYDRAQFLKTKLDELNAQISVLRKRQKNPIVPDLLVKLVKPKIEYFSVTNDEKDYDAVLRYFDEIINEINYCENEKDINIKNELNELLAKNT